MQTKATNRLVVIGGVAAGMSAASQAKRRQPDLEVVVFEKGPWVSYGACGMPYNIQDPKRPIEDLVVISADRFRNERGIDLHTDSEVIDLDLAARTVTFETSQGDRRLEFDQLVLATGCRPKAPSFANMDLPGVFFLHTLKDAKSIKHYLAEQNPRRAVVIGGGHIGLEMTDVLVARGLAVTLLKRNDAVPTGYPEPVATLVREEIGSHGVELITGSRVTGFTGQGQVESVETDKGSLPADLVLVATGVEPVVNLATKAGIRLGTSGAIAVDDQLGTSAEGVFAAGDCAEAYHLLTGQGAFIPRGTTANKQGRICGANVVGAGQKFRGVLGTSITKVFDMAVGHTGLMEAEAQQAGFAPQAIQIKARSRAHAYPGAKDIHVRLVFDQSSGRVLGAQMAGGEGIAKRLDVIAAALQANFTVEDLGALDLSYAPPFAPVWDPILVAANIARKKVK